MKFTIAIEPATRNTDHGAVPNLRRGWPATDQVTGAVARARRVDGAGCDKHLPPASSWATASSCPKNLSLAAGSLPIAARASSTTASTASRKSSLSLMSFMATIVPAAGSAVARRHPDTGSRAQSAPDQRRQRQTLAGRRRAAQVAPPARFPSWPSLVSGKVAIQTKWIESQSNDGVARNRSDHYDRNGGGNQQICPRRTLTMSEDKEGCAEYQEKRRERKRANCEQEEEYKWTEVDGRVAKGRMAARKEKCQPKNCNDQSKDGRLYRRLHLAIHLRSIAVRRNSHLCMQETQPG